MQKRYGENRPVEGQAGLPARIHSDLIHELYLLKLRSGLPMTVLVEMAISMLLVMYQKNEGEAKTDDS
jgi:hypothetical protein